MFTELPACRKELVGVSIQKLKPVSDVSRENTPEEEGSSVYVPLSVPFLLLLFLSGGTQSIQCHLCAQPVFPFTWPIHIPVISGSTLYTL